MQPKGQNPLHQFLRNKSETSPHGKLATFPSTMVSRVRVTAALLNLSLSLVCLVLMQISVFYFWFYCAVIGVVNMDCLIISAQFVCF